MNAPTQWLLTVLFFSAGAYCVLRCVHFKRTGCGHPVSAWVTELAHLAMSAAMVSMTWVATGWDRWSLQLTASLVIAGWFVVRAVAGPSPDHMAVSAATRPVLLYEATSFAAMCWMLTRMGGTTAMPGMAGASMAGPVLPAAWVAPITLALVTALLVGAVAWVRQFGRAVLAVAPGAPPGPGRVVFGPAGEAACQAAMSVGMVVALLTLL